MGIIRFNKSSFKTLLGTIVFSFLFSGCANTINNSYKPTLREVDEENVYDKDDNLLLDDNEKEKIANALNLNNTTNNSYIMYAVMMNQYLSDEEKNILYNLSDMFKDNPYLDCNDVYTRLLNVNILCSERKTPYFEYDESIRGCYINKYNDILYFEDELNKEVICHEAIHCIMNNKNNPRWFSEGMAELLTIEYVSDNPYELSTSYKYEVTLVKLLCELIGPDKVLEAYTTDNPIIIYDELSKINGSSEDAKNMLDTFEKCIIEYNNYSNVEIEEITDEEVSISFKQLNEYINNNYLLEKDFAYYQLSLFLTLFTDEYGTFEYVNSFKYNKVYFNKDLMLSNKEKIYSFA